MTKRPKFTESHDSAARSVGYEGAREIRFTEEAVMEDFRAGQVYSYRPRNAWCHHGLAHVFDQDGVLYICDTYWGLRDNERANPVEKHGMDELRLVFDMNEGEKTDSRTYDRYRDEDKLWIPIGGGSQSYWIRKGAAPDTERILSQLDSEEEQQRSKIRMAEWKLEEIRKEREEVLSEFPAQPVTGDVTSGVE